MSVVIAKPGAIVMYLKSMHFSTPIWTTNRDAAMKISSTKKAEEIIDVYVLPFKCHPMTIPSS